MYIRNSILKMFLSGELRGTYVHMQIFSAQMEAVVFIMLQIFFCVLNKLFCNRSAQMEAVVFIMLQIFFCVLNKLFCNRLSA